MGTLQIEIFLSILQIYVKGLFRSAMGILYIYDNFGILEHFIFVVKYGLTAFLQLFDYSL